jgi:outer membrane surface antigen
MIILLHSQRERICPRHRRGGLYAALALVATAFALAGCSIAIPLPSLIDDDPTGSIKPKATAAALSTAYQPDDWRLAEPALSATLRAKDGGEGGRWSNPQTGGHGEFVAVAGSFARDGRSCRAFVARIAGKDGMGDKVLQGVGCPREGEEAAVYDVSPWTGL